MTTSLSSKSTKCDQETAEIPMQGFADVKENNNPKKQLRNSCKVRRMYLAAASCQFLALTMGLATGYSAAATYDMKSNPHSPFKPTESEITWISSILAIGIIVGGVCAGPIINKIGRKDTLVYTIVPAGLGWLTIAYGRSAAVIVAGRFFSGLVCGTIHVTVPTYSVEIATADSRGLLGSGYHGFMVIGYLLSVTIGYYIPWNYLALNGAVFSIVGVAVFTLMPESPRWLLAQGRLKEAIGVMHWLHGDRIDAEAEASVIYDDLKTKPKLSWREVSNPTIYKPTLIAIVLYFFNQFTGSNAILFYSSEIFVVSKDFMDPKKATILLAAVQVTGTLLSNFVVDKAGRKVLLIVSSGSMALALTVMGIYYYKSTGGSSDYIWVPLSSLVLYVFTFALGYGPVTVLLTAELLPTKARGTMTGVISVFVGAFVFIVTKTFDDLESAFGNYGAFWFYAGFALLGVFFIVFVVPETKGKKLEELESLFQSQQKMNSSVNNANTSP